jgi:hypothetical protein
MRVLVCGGRDFTDQTFASGALDGIWRARGEFDLVIHGAARGADTLAQNWADEMGVCCLAFPAKWKEHGRGAGPIRNQQMMDEGKPDMVIAFPRRSWNGGHDQPCSQGRY